MRAHRHLRRRPRRGAGPQIEARLVQRAFDGAVLYPAVGEGRILMRAGVVDRKQSLVGVENRDRAVPGTVTVETSPTGSWASSLTRMSPTTEMSVPVIRVLPNGAIVAMNATDA